ncbi:MAG: ABC transporter permease subunit [Armatimonadetes bacterium]|nr:ABC transporter permease subunit [Armatimonadota bacterium]
MAFRSVLNWCLLFLLLAAPASAGTLDEIRERGVIEIGTDATYPPFEWKEGDRFRGFDIDIGEALAKELGVKARWMNTAWDGIFPALLSKKFDLIISITTITPDRRKIMAFSEPYYTSGNILAVRKEDARRIQSLNDLRGKTAGAQLGTTAQTVLEKFGGIEVRKYNTLNDELLDLRNGRIDAVAAEAPVLWWAIKTGYSDLVTVGDLITSEKYGIPMRKEDTDLIAAVNQALRKMRADGTYDRIYSKWFGQGAQPQAAAVEKNLQEAGGAAESRAGFFRRMLPLLLRGAVITLQLALAGLVGGLVLGLVLALVRLGKVPVLRSLAVAYIEVVRGTPLLVQIFFIYFVLPEAGIRLPQLATGMVAFSLNSAAYIAEIFRAGIESIEAGQREAALALGLTERQAMRWVVLPQAFRRSIPPLTNEAVALLKDSSLVSIMGLAELTRTGQELISRYANPFTLWPAVGLIYLCMTLPLTYLSRRLERRLETR